MTARSVRYTNVVAHFTYTAQRSDGDVYQGVADAKDRFELYQIVRGEGARLIAVAEQRQSGVWNFSYWSAKFGSVSEYQKILFARNLGAMLSAGLSLARALSTMERQIKSPRMAALLTEIGSDVRRGDQLNVALGKHSGAFSKLFIAMVRAGEEGGDLPVSLSLIADQMERMYTLKKKVRGALIYPTIVVVAMIGIAILMMTSVVPTLAQTFAEMNLALPLSTQIIVGISAFLVTYTTLALSIFVGLIATLYMAGKTERGKRAGNWLVLHTPIIGTLSREVNAARTARTLSSLLSSGVDVLSSLDIVADVVQNPYFKDVVRAARTGVAQGELLSAQFVRREDLYPAFVGEMMAVGEETGQTTDMLSRLAAFYESEVDRKTKDMSTIIEPFLMVLIGAGVGFFALSMITPIYQMTGSM